MGDTTHPSLPGICAAHVQLHHTPDYVVPPEDAPLPAGGGLPPPPSPPTSSGDGPARPAFLMGGGLSSLASFQRVKARDELVDFTAYSPKTSPESWAMSPTQRIREFDTYRLHTAGLPERGQVSIPSSIDRINITNLNHLLILCGGYAGVRFATEVTIIHR